MNITPPGDDLGLQRLKIDDSHREVKETRQVEPFPRIESSEERHESHEVPMLERRKQRRRKRQRRQFSQRTLLDTRDDHERRHELRRKSDQPAAKTESGETPPPLSDHGIDERA